MRIVKIVRLFEDRQPEYHTISDVANIYQLGFQKCFLNFFRSYGVSYLIDEISRLEQECHKVIKDFHMRSDFTLTDVIQYQNLWKQKQSSNCVPRYGIAVQQHCVGPDGIANPQWSSFHPLLCGLPKPSHCFLFLPDIIWRVTSENCNSVFWRTPTSSRRLNCC